MKKLLKTQDVAEMLGVSPITLAIWRTKERGPAFVRLGRKVGYRQEDIETWLASCRIQPGKRPKGNGL